MRALQLSAPSPTVNTREALQVVMGMFNNPLDIHKNLGWEGKERDLDDSQLEDEFAATRGT